MKNIKIKKIGIDARFYGPIGKGLGRYTQEVVDNLLNIDKKNEYVVFLGKENFETFHTNNSRVKKVLTNVRWYTILEQIMMPYYIWRENVDLMHFHHFNVPIFCPTKFVVTIHDLILIKYPSLRATKLPPLLYKIKNKAYRFVLNFAVRKSEKIIAVSEFTKNDILENFSIKSDKVLVTYEGVSERLLNGDSKDKEAILNKYKIKKPYLLYVGNAYPHKNLEWLIDVFCKELNNIEVNLVLVGKIDYFYGRLKTQVTNNHRENSDNKQTINFPGYVSDEDLFVLYQEALVYVFPSKYEGFGIPPLEAMANDTPVISSDRASMPEILGDSCEYFNPDDSKEFSLLVEKIYKDEILRKKMVAKGREQVKQYSWFACAEETLKILEENS